MNLYEITSNNVALVRHIGEVGEGKYLKIGLLNQKDVVTILNNFGKQYVTVYTKLGIGIVDKDFVNEIS